jgi:superfamily II DNA or RNA helicase
MPVSWKGTLFQYAGRLHRLHPGKREVRVYDYAEVEEPMLRRMFEKRLRGYQCSASRTLSTRWPWRRLVVPHCQTAPRSA